MNNTLDNTINKTSYKYISGALDCISNTTPLSNNIDYLIGYQDFQRQSREVVK